MMRKRTGILTYLMVGLIALSLLLPSGVAWAEQDNIVPVAASIFTDITEKNDGLVYINYINGRGIVNGFPDGSFRPNEGLTRAEAAVIISKAANLPVSDPQASAFSDVSIEHWALRYINAAVGAGYLKGLGDGTYQPDAALTRAQAISLIFRLSSEADSEVPLPSLSDMDTSHWAARAMAMAIDANMINLQANNIKPDADISRGDLCQALAILLISDNKLANLPLYGILTVKNGEVMLSKANGEPALVTSSKQVGTGDTIKTLAGASAQINYPDGSSILLKANSTLSIKESQGKAYIKQNGKPGTAVDALQLDLQAGTIFGALSDLAIMTMEDEADVTAWKKGLNLLAANTESFDFLAAKEAPWYKTAEKKKVKVTVDMPWGVAAIRGTFWHNTVNPDGTGNMSLLQGNGSVSQGGQSVNLAPSQSTIGTLVQPPTPPAPMTPEQARGWTNEQGWVNSTVGNISNNVGAPPPSAPPPPNMPSNSATPPFDVPPHIPSQIVQNLFQSVNNALTQAGQTANTRATSSSSNSGSSGSSGGGSTPSAGTITVQPNLPDNSTLHLPLGQEMTYTFTTNVTDATLSITGNAHFTCVPTMTGNEITLKSTGTSLGDDTVTFTIAKTGYTTLIKSIKFRVIPKLEIGYEYDDSTYLYISAPTTPTIWNEGDSLYISVINEQNLLQVQVSTTPTATGPNSANCTIYPALSDGIYYVLVSNGTTPLGIGMVNIQATLPPDDSFVLENIIVNDANSGVNHEVYDSLTFRFSEAIDVATLGNDFLGEIIFGENTNYGYYLSIPGIGYFGDVPGDADTIKTILSNSLKPNQGTSKDIIFMINRNEFIDYLWNIQECYKKSFKVDNEMIENNNNSITPITVDVTVSPQPNSNTATIKNTYNNETISQFNIRIWGYDNNNYLYYLDENGQWAEGNEDDLGTYWKTVTRDDENEYPWIINNINYSTWSSQVQSPRCDVNISIGNEPYTLINTKFSFPGI